MTLHWSQRFPDTWVSDSHLWETWDHLAKFSFILTSFLTVAGWFFVAAQTDKREFRKEVREHVKAIFDRSQRVREIAVTYWLGATEGEMAASIALKAEVLALSRQIQTLGVLGLDIPAILVSDIRQAATGGDFESSNRKRVLLADTARVSEATAAIGDMIQSVDEAFYRKFPPLGGSLLRRIILFVRGWFKSAGC